MPFMRLNRHFFLLQEKKKADPNATLQVTGAVSWRREGIKYKKNEVRSSSGPPEAAAHLV
jgi:hypothetical protein